jgi:hypothetical protein
MMIKCLKTWHWLVWNLHKHLFIYAPLGQNNHVC